ncbi:fibronectin type III domain-containing protein 3B isoform X2 [Ischnura elegans]|uniref:fibronectin type III domain-containing protein 3B isoform X2 n=1 Tax=Ischnura elegans TaxID=197161 RepID=UPI001ED8865A|nr:fibronectin type III domain-containing protein 3B isoform X2 [Ischnura elegans]
MSFARDEAKRKEWVPGCGRCDGRYPVDRGGGRREGGGGKGFRFSGGGRGYTPFVMLDAMVAENHEDMYCSQSPYDYYAPTADFHVFSPGQPPHPQHNHQDMCPPGMCTIHDYGPVTVPMVSTNTTPPMAMPVRVPPGHVVQQIVDESGTLRHVILSPTTHALLTLATPYGPGGGSGQGPPTQTFYQGLPPPHGYPPPHAPFHGLAMAAGPHTSPPASSDMGNGMMSGRRRSRESVGMVASVGDDLSNQQDEEVEGEAGKLLSELLASTRPPQVSNLEPRSALLHWSQPTTGREPTGSDGCVTGLPSGSELCYEVLLSERGKEGKYRLIYSGDSLSCRVEDLRPGTDYWVKLQVRWRRKSVMQSMGGGEGSLGSWEGAGPPSEPTAFSTPPCAPDAPMPPKLISRGRTNLQLRWNAGVDNGSHISQYVLEWDQGRQILGGETIGEDEVGPPPELTFTEVYRGRGKQTTLSKLQPSTCYSFRVYAINECGKSDYSEVVQLWTSGSPPAQPPPPTLREARVNSLSLAWDNRKSDGKGYRGDDNSRNGTLEYTLQMEDPSTGHGFLPVYSGVVTHCTCSGLARHSEFKFRLRAANEEGPSKWSDEVSYLTLPAPPTAPSRPVLVKPHVGRGKGGGQQRSKPPESSLTVHASSFSPRKGSNQITPAPSPGCPVGHPIKVKWDPPSDNGGAPIALYTLQMDSGSGFETVYTGLENEYTIKAPIPGTTYRLKVSCSGPGGHGPFSDITSIVADIVPPSAPLKPRVINARTRPTSLSIKWGGPEFNGGAAVTDYEVDMLEDEEGDNEGAEGESRHSESESGDIKKQGNDDGDKKSEGPLGGRNRKKRRTVYRGKELECTAAELLPGRTYAFQVRAYNRAGAGSWSDMVEGLTGAGPPSAPMNLTASAKSFSNVIVQWDEPASLNGAPVSSYRLEMSVGKEDGEGSSDGSKEEPVFSAIHTGSSRSHEVKGLSPATSYSFRVRAINSAGVGPYSATCLCCTPPSVPGPFPGPPRLAPLLGSSAGSHEERPSSRASSSSSSTSSSAALTTSSCHSSPVLAEDVQPVPLASCTSLEVVWDEPPCNGSFISQYVVHVSEVGVTGGDRVLVVPPVLYVVIEDLQPDTAYRIKVQAENSCGLGPYSPVLKACTQPLPPNPPHLECQSSGHAQIRLRWTSAASQMNSLSPSFSTSSHDVKYTVQMQNPRTKDFQNVWHGTGLSCKVNRLAEGKSYFFRIAAANLSGRGPFSKAYEFRTSLAPPPTLRSPRCVEVSKNGCVLEWQSCRAIGGDPVVYQVQLCRMRDQEYKQVYHGSETKVTLNDLESGAEYGARVCPIRLLGGGSNGELPGSPSPPVKFSTPSSIALSSNGSGSNASNNGNCSEGSKLLQASQTSIGERKPLTDQQWAAIIVFGFTIFSIAMAFIVQHSLLWAQREEN